MSDKKRILWFDCGTTNTRLYLIDSKMQFSCCGTKAIGSRNVAITGTSLVLAQAMGELYQETLAQFHLAQEDISCVYASGMITSALGLKEVAHLEAPVSPQKLRQALRETIEQTIELYIKSANEFKSKSAKKNK